MFRYLVAHAPTFRLDRCGWSPRQHVILVAEEKVEALQAESNDPDLANNHERMTTVWSDLAAAQSEVERLYARWSELEGKQG